MQNFKGIATIRLLVRNNNRMNLREGDKAIIELTNKGEITKLQENEKN